MYANTLDASVAIIFIYFSNLKMAFNSSFMSCFAIHWF